MQHCGRVAAGNFGWAYTFGSTGSDYGFGIAVGADGTVNQAGSYQGIVNFDPFATYCNGPASFPTKKCKEN